MNPSGYDKFMRNIENLSSDPPKNLALSNAEVSPDNRLFMVISQYTAKGSGNNNDGVKSFQDYGNVGKAYDGNRTMNSPVSKDVLDARLEAIEARMDARVSGMSSKLDATLAEIRADRGRFTQLESDLREVKVDLKAFPDRIDAKLQQLANSTDTQIRGLKSNIWFGVATTIASLLAVLAVTFAAFDSGREMSKNISEATARMERVQLQLESSAKAQTSAASAPQTSKP